jgi:hypothetical protein
MDLRWWVAVAAEMDLRGWVKAATEVMTFVGAGVVVSRARYATRSYLRRVVVLQLR